MTATRWALAGAVAIAATACGTQPHTAARPEPRVSADPSAAPSPVMSVAPGSETVATFVARAHAAFNALTDYRMKLSFWQKLGASTSSGVYDMEGKQPRTLRIDIVSGNSVGTKLLWQGGATCRIRPTGFLGAITVDLPIVDDRVTSLRGYSLAQTDVPAMFEQIDAVGNHAVLVAPGVVEVTGPHLLSGCVKMRGSFNPVTALPTMVEMWDRQELVVRLKLDNLRRIGNWALDI